MPPTDNILMGLNTWPEWRLALDNTPTIIRPVLASKTHYLLNAAGMRLVLRTDVPGNSSSISRQNEHVILEVIQGKPFAPVVFYSNVDKGILVTEYIEGYQWQPDELTDSIKVDSLVELVGQIHQITQGIPPYDYGTQISNYWKQLLDSDEPFPMSALKMYRDLEQGMGHIQAAMGQPVLCHHNLVPGNIIEDSTGQLKVLGWKFAGAGSPVIDAVGLGRSWRNPELTTRLIEAESIEAHPMAQQIIDFYELVLPLLH